MVLSQHVERALSRFDFSCTCRKSGQMSYSKQYCVSGHSEGMVVATQAQQQLMETGVGVGVEGGAEVEMMVMDSLDPTLLQMKTEVSLLMRAMW